MSITDIVAFIERLNLAHHQSIIGTYFPEIIALLSIVFGGSFLLFGWRHHEYFLGVTGLLAGGWAGLLLKNHLAPEGTMAPFMYLAVGASAGAFIGACWTRFVGILLGGFSTMLFASVFVPAMAQKGQPSFASIAAIFLLGGGLGGLFPKLFFILNSSLMGAAFATYGISLSVLAHMTTITPQIRVLLHLVVFLPLFIFGMVYQGMSGRNQEIRVIVENRPEKKPAAKPRPAVAADAVTES